MISVQQRPSAESVSGDIEAGAAEDHGPSIPFRHMREVPMMQRVPPNWQERIKPLLDTMDKFGYDKNVAKIAKCALYKNAATKTSRLEFSGYYRSNRIASRPGRGVI